MAIRQPGFGRWIREIRHAKGLSQGALANEVRGLSQPDLSMIERQGAIPPDKILAGICRVLGKTLDEAHIAIHNTSASHLRNDQFTADRQRFITFLQGESNASASVDLCIVRDTPLPSEQTKIALYLNILSRLPLLRIQQLFLHEDLVCSNSFRRLAGQMRNEGTVTTFPQQESNTPPQERFLGFSSALHNKHDHLPLQRPYVLAIGERHAQLFDFEITDDDPATASTLEERLRIRESELDAAKVVDWIGFSDRHTVDPKRWVPID